MGSESKNGAGEFSLATRKMIRSLKEIVDCPDSEIYAVLKECNMDPDDAVNRLLSQDTFHEVKSKRERRKEMKETQELRPRVNYCGSSRGNRSASDRYSGWSGSIQTHYEEMSNAAHKGENSWVAPSQSYSTPNLNGETTSQQPSFNSDSLNTNSRGQSIGTGGAISTMAQSFPGGQPAWSGTSAGHLSMADVVRLGRHSSKGSQISSEVSYTHLDAVTANSYHYHQKPSQVSAPIQAESHHDWHPPNTSNVSRVIYKSDITDWSVVEHPTAARSSTLDESVFPDADIYSNQPNNYINGSKLPRNCRLDSVQASDGNVTGENITSDHIVSASASSGQKSVTNDSGASHGDDSESGSGSNLSDPSYSAPLTDDIITVPSAAAKLQHLNLEEAPETNSAFVLPSHLQALAADCSHLSFGTYKSGNNSASTALFQSNQLKDDHQEASSMLDGLPAGPVETRKMGYDADESLGALHNTRETMADSKNYDLNASFHSELMKKGVSEVMLGSEFIKSSLCDSNIENIEHTTPELPFARTDPNFRSIPVQNEAIYLDSKPSESLMSNIQSLRDPDSLHAQLLMKQSIPSRHINAVSSMGSSSISFSEDRKPPDTFSLSAASSVLPQHRIANSQPTLTLEQPSNNMIGYSGLPQSYSHLPSAFQQAYPGSDKISLTDLKYSLPQYGASMSSRFPGASATADYGSYVMPNNGAGGYLHNSPPMIPNTGYDDLIHRQYRDADHFNPLQQNSSSSTWNHGPGSRKLPSAQDIAYYNLLGQNQQYPGYRQDQQPSQYYGGLGYSDLYQSQTGMAREHQQHDFGGSSSAGSRDLLSQQLHQLWQRH